MKPIKQLFRHQPQLGIYGDCERACIASLLDLECADVPNFCQPDPGEEFSTSRWRQRETAWLRGRGIARIGLCFHHQLSLQTVLDNVAYYNPGIYWILTGESANGCNHSVVACDGAIVHDPSIDQSGIRGPCDDGHFWATFLGSAIASKATNSAQPDDGPPYRDAA